MVRDAVCVDGEPTLPNPDGADRTETSTTSTSTTRRARLSATFVKVVFESLILIEDKVEVYFHIRMQRVKFKPFPFGANSLSDGKLILDVTAAPGAARPLANVMISLPIKYVLIWSEQKGLFKS